MPYSDQDEQNAYTNEYVQQRRREWLRSVGNKCRDCGSRKNLVRHFTGAGEPPHGVFNMSEQRRTKILALCIPLCRKCEGKRRRMTTGGGVPHGTITGYKHYGCRCDACREANRERVASQRRNRRAALPTEER